MSGVRHHPHQASIFRGGVVGSVVGNRVLRSPSSNNSTSSGIAVTMRLLIVSLTVVAICIMTLNLFFAYSRLGLYHRGSHEDNSESYFLSEKAQKQPWGQKMLLPTKKQKSELDNTRKYDADKANTDSCDKVESVQDMIKCYPPKLVQQLLISSKRLPSTCWGKSSKHDGTEQSTILLHNWTQIQSCLTFVRANSTIRHIHILGERHSGTKFVQQELQQCFPRSSERKVHRDLRRSKHFFQPLSTFEDYSESLIVAVFRDPLDWTEAMRTKPYHAPFHLHAFHDEKKHSNSHQQSSIESIVPLPWEDFIQRPWTMPRKAIYELVNHTSTGCRYDFSDREIIPCLYNPASKLIPQNRIRGFEPIYEMKRKWNDLDKSTADQAETLHRTNDPFDTVLDLRSDKIVHMLLELPLLLPNLGGFIAVRYEDLLVDGMSPLTNWISQNVVNGVPCHKPPARPQPHLLHSRQDSMPKEFKNWIRSHLNRNTERMLGYVT